jgi:hypothetical protein
MDPVRTQELSVLSCVVKYAGDSNRQFKMRKVSEF